MRILVFGDSIVYGAWDKEGGWVDRLKKDIHNLTLDKNNLHKFQLINLGIGGETSSGLLNRLESEIKARSSWPLALVIGIGTNDTRIKIDEDKPENSLEQYVDKLSQILEVGRKYSSYITFVGLTNLAYDEIKFKEVKYRNELMKTYNETLKSFCTKHSVDFISLSTINHSDVIHEDGLHPNTKGHQEIYNIIKPILFKQYGIN